MEALNEPEEMDIGSSVESFGKFLDSQRELFHSQISQLQKIVVAQCKLTGANPLSQEMAAGALSIKIGKRPRDLLNPKAVKYMQELFAIKDAITKKEIREISALFGVTVTQVRDFFNSQRTRVRKIVRLSREKAVKSSVCKDTRDENPTSIDSVKPLEPVPLNSVDPTNAEEAPSCSTQDDTLPGLDDVDKRFVDNIFTLMRKEETFSGQVKLMEWILQIQNSSVLNWYLTKGGVMILATWLSQAAIEEQTSVLLVILKVLCHLPLQRALPEHMSAILQSVNRLRFYRTSDISNRARVLLSRWSKIFARSQALKKPNGTKSSIDTQNEILLKQSIGEIMGDESWQSITNISEGAIVPSHEGLENLRKLESTQTLKLLPSSMDDSARKPILGLSSSHNRERRKVQLVEQPGQKTSGRSPQATRVVPVSQGRPMSADDIQKAKLRALYMQSKYGKTVSSSNGSNEPKPETLNKPSTSQPSLLLAVSKVHVQPKTEEQKKPQIVPLPVSSRPETLLDSKQKMDSKESLWERCKRVQTCWQIPPEIVLNDLWRVGAGDNSKEVDVQKNRNRREKETIYRTMQEIPSNPREPWDIEMDYDDTLTPEIPTEQPPDADATETQATHNEHVNNAVGSAPSLLQTGSENAAEPDLELLAVLLKNPDLVFALTSGHAGNMSSEQMVKLLDMIKAGGSGLGATLNGLSGKVKEKVEASLPSPTPPSPSTSGWKPEVSRNPFTERGPMESTVAFSSPGVTAAVPTVQKLPAASFLQPQNPSINAARLQESSILSSLSQQAAAAMPPLSLPQTSSIIPEKRLQNTMPPPHQTSSEIRLTMKNVSISTTSLPNLPQTIGPSMSNALENQSTSFALRAPTQSNLHSQQQPYISDPLTHAPLHSVRPLMGNVGPVPESWGVRQGMVSNPRSQANQNNYNGPYGGAVQPKLLSGHSWEGNEYGGGGEGFESWSPENSPTRSTMHMAGRNVLEPRMDSGWNYRPDRSTQRNPSGYRETDTFGYWESNRQGNRRWRDRRH